MRAEGGCGEVRKDRRLMEAPREDKEAEGG